MTFHHDAPSIHVQGINFIEFLVHARNSVPYIMGPRTDIWDQGPRAMKNKYPKKQYILSFSSRGKSFCRYLENAKFRNVFM